MFDATRTQYNIIIGDNSKFLRDYHLHKRRYVSSCIGKKLSMLVFIGA